MRTFDVVVAGAGHNSLVTAAYLAKAGYEVCVLEAREIAGGGAVSEELTLPGYLFDSCSTGHTLLQPNPLMRDDELGLKSRYGLEYISPDPVAHVVFPDGEWLTHWLDLDRTCDEIARFSKRDADAYRRLLVEFDEIRAPLGRYRFNPIGRAPSLEEAFADKPRWLRRMAMSSWQVIRHEFEDPHVRSYLLWQAFQTAQPVDALGSGVLAYSIVAGRQAQSWILPRGGSGELTRALVQAFEDLGGTLLLGKRVGALLLEGGRCAGVETDDGERYHARHAVVSTIHVKHLVELAPRSAWDEDFLFGIDTYDPGISMFAQYYATSVAPEFAGGRSAVSAGVVGWPEDVVAAGRYVREGKLLHARWMLIATPTIVDPSRAPAGGHTVKLLTMAPWERAWDDALTAEVAEENYHALLRAAPNMTRDVVLGERVKSPVDIERLNEHMWHGTIHGGDRGYASDGLRRPAPGWAQHRMPIPGLYQTGATTHPGGSITAAPGRNCAIVLLEDLGTSLEAVLAREPAVPDARVEAAIAHWAPRFTSQGVDMNDFRAVTASVERWEWLPAWVANGDMHAELAREAEAVGRKLTAGQAWVRAALSYHFAKFVWMLDMSRYEDAQNRAIDAVAEAHRLLDPSAERIEIPLDGFTMAGNLRKPAGVAKPPLVLLLPGLDSTKEEFFHWEEVFLERGLATFSVDGPGQGETGLRSSIYPDYERAVTAVLDEVDGFGAVGVAGVSLGGYYAPRAAAYEKRIRAVAGISGPFNFGDCWDSMPQPTRETVAHHTRAATLEEAREKANELDLADGAPRIDQPMLVVTGKLDRLIPWQQSERIAKAAPNATWVLYEEGNHVCNNIPYKYRPLTADWLAEQLAA